MWLVSGSPRGGCDFLHIRRPTGLSLHLGPLQGHFPVMEGRLLTRDQDVKEVEEFENKLLQDPLSISWVGAPTLHYGLNHYSFLFQQPSM